MDYALKTSSGGDPIDFRSDAYILHKIVSRIADFTSYSVEVIKKMYQFLQLENGTFILLNFIAESADSHNYARVLRYSHSCNCHLMHHGRIVYPNYFSLALHTMMQQHILSNMNTTSLLQQLNTLQNIYDNLKQEKVVQNV